MKKTTIVGIDYSLNSPAICICKDEEFDFDKCSFYYLTSKKKHLGKIRHNIQGDEHKEYNDPIERFENLSTWAIHKINTFSNIQNDIKVFIEGYSFGSKGQAVFQIAENAGILKYRLRNLSNFKYDTVVPSVVKKYATGKGNADKQLMYDTFTKEHKVDLKKDFDMQTLNNPVTDIIDSYYIAKCGYEKSKKI